MAMDAYDEGRTAGQKGIATFINTVLATQLTDEKKIQLIADFVKAWEA